MSFVEFVCQRFGSNWVVSARRTARLVERYGENVVVITPRKYAKARKEWDQLPHACVCERCGKVAA